MPLIPTWYCIQYVWLCQSFRVFGKSARQVSSSSKFRDFPQGSALLQIHPEGCWLKNGMPMWHSRCTVLWRLSLMWCSRALSSRWAVEIRHYYSTQFSAASFIELFVNPSLLTKLHYCNMSNTTTMKIILVTYPLVPSAIWTVACICSVSYT